MRHSGMMPRLRVGARIAAAFSLAAVLPLCGCRALPPLPPANISGPGWQLQQGQAIWKPTRSRPELAGELILATHINGDFFIQFTKTPFTMATAQVVGNQWEIEFGNGERRWSGRGNPPARFSWFQLPHALADKPIAKNWRFARTAPETWRLENRRTGESLEGGFFQ